MELQNKIVGRNIAKYRRLKDMKAADLAERIGMKENNYSKYERGEANITIEFVQKVAEALEVDPISILTASPDNFIDSIKNNEHSQGIGIGNTNTLDVKGDYNAENKPLTEAILKQNETLIDLMKTVIEVLRGNSSSRQ